MQSPMDPQGCSGFSRRSFFRFAAGASALATMPILTEARLALAARPHFADPNKGIHIDANENPLGPSESARQAMINIVPRGGRYLFPMEDELSGIFAKQEGLNPESVIPFAGSSEYSFPLRFPVNHTPPRSSRLMLCGPVPSSIWYRLN